MLNLIRRKITTFYRIRVSNDIRSTIILINYRIGHYINNINIPIIKKFGILIFTFFNLLVKIIFSAEIPPECKIGGGIFLAHGGVGIVIHPRAIIGNNVTIYHGVTIGGSGLAHHVRNDGTIVENINSGVPIIKDGVLIGVGAKIIGKVVIGSNVVIGANTVIVQDIPDNCTVVGASARIICK